MAKDKSKKSVSPATPAPVPIDPHVRYMLAWRGTVEIARALIKYGAYVLITYFLARTAAAFAGEQTSVLVNMLIEWKVKDVVLILVAMGAFGNGVRERVLRKKLYEQLGSLRKEYEKLADPERDSSGLNPDGELADDRKLL